MRFRPYPTFALAVLLLSFLLPMVSRADIEPAMEDLVPVYILREVQGAGHVQVLKEGSSDWTGVKRGYQLEEGDHLLVGDQTQVILSLRSGTLVRVDEGSELAVARLSEDPEKGFSTLLKLLNGSVLCDMKTDPAQGRFLFEVSAGGVIAGGHDGLFEMSVQGDRAVIRAAEGAVLVASTKDSLVLEAGQTCLALPSRELSLHALGAEAAERFKDWKDQRRPFLQRKTLSAAEAGAEGP